MIEDCVAAWLWDIRHATEIECGSILFAKSLLSEKPDQDFSNFMETRRKVVYEDANSPELILGGQIPIGLEENKGHPEEFDRISISLAPESKMRRCHELECSDTKDSVFSESYNSMDQSPSSVKVSSPKFLLQKQSSMDHEGSSRDSACGSSPILSTQDYVPVNWNSHLNETLSIETYRSEIPFMPCYTQLQDTLRYILNTTSHLYAQLAVFHNTDHRRLLATVQLFIEQAESSGCGPFLCCEDLSTVKCQSESLIVHKATAVPEQYAQSVKRLCEQVLVYFTKIILRYLTECDNIDNIIPTALEQLAHLALFGNEIRLKIIQVGAVRLLTRLCRQIETRTDVIRLALRVLAVLCSSSKGCNQLQSLGGMDLVIRLLCQSSFNCSVEAAGVLTQLTAPCHSFAALPSSLPKVVSRLIDLCDQCSDSDSYLLCAAALANLCMQHTSVVEQFYRQNAILRICRAFQTKKCQSIFVREQLSTIFARLSANGYDHALVSQGAIPCLLELLKVNDNRYQDLSKRIRYKAAICLGTIAARGYGLKSVYENQGFDSLMIVLRLEKGQRNPVNMICHSLISRLQAKYELETFV